MYANASLKLPICTGSEGRFGHPTSATAAAYFTKAVETSPQHLAKTTMRPYEG
jgi:hypothetical protein